MHLITDYEEIDRFGKMTRKEKMNRKLLSKVNRLQSCLFKLIALKKGNEADE